MAEEKNAAKKAGDLQYIRPGDIERRSFAIITEELGDFPLPAAHAPVVKRVIHTTADFDYARNLAFSPDAVERGLEALRAGACLVTDTNMALAGVSKPALQALGCTARCFMAEPDVAEEAGRRGLTRAVVSMERAARLPGPLIFAVGNAPTALIRLCELIQEGAVSPALVVGAPVGFVNVVESKELLLRTPAPYIAALGRKGGSTVAAAVCNALLYQAWGRRV